METNEASINRSTNYYPACNGEFEMNISAKISLFILSVVVASSFVLSFTAISALASENGITAPLNWLLPVIIDGGMIVFAVALLEGQMQYGKRPYAIVGLVGLYVAISIGFNIAHSNRTATGIAIAVIISFTVFASFEVALWQIKQLMQSKKGDLQHELQSAKSKINELQNDLNVANGKLEVLDLLQQRWQTINSDYQTVIRFNAGEFGTAKEAAQLTTLEYPTFTRTAKRLNGVEN